MAAYDARRGLPRGTPGRMIARVRQQSSSVERNTWSRRFSCSKINVAVALLIINLCLTICLAFFIALSSPSVEFKLPIALQSGQTSLWPREERALKTEMIRKNISAFGVDVLKDTFDAGLGDLAVFKTTKIRPTSSPTVISTRDLKESELIPDSLDDRRREGECSCRRRKCKM